MQLSLPIESLDRAISLGSLKFLTAFFFSRLKLLFLRIKVQDFKPFRPATSSVFRIRSSNLACNICRTELTYMPNLGSIPPTVFELEPEQTSGRKEGQLLPLIIKYRYRFSDEKVTSQLNPWSSKVRSNIMNTFQDVNVHQISVSVSNIIKNFSDSGELRSITGQQCL